MRSVLASWLLAGALLCATTIPLLAADAGGPIILDAKSHPGADAKIYRDARATGKRCVVVKLDVKPGNEEAPPIQHLFSYKGSLPAGDYVLTAWIEAKPISTMHGLKIVLAAGSSSRTLGPIDFDGSPVPGQPLGSTPAGGYQPFILHFTHLGGDCPITINAVAHAVLVAGTDKTDDEKQQNSKKIDMDDSHLLDQKAPNADPMGDAAGGKDDFDLEEDPAIEKIPKLDKRVLCDRVEITTLRTCLAMVAGVDVDKVHYFPDETVKAIAHLNGGPAGGTFKLVADDITEIDTARRVFAQDVTLTPKQSLDVTFEYPLNGGPEFGHELHCKLLQGDKEVHGASEFYGVSLNVYRIGIYANDASGQDKTKATRESIRAGMLQNKKNYGNWFEEFSWAPCSYSNLTPQTEDWYSGQTQYHGTKTGFKTMIEEAHRVGIKAITYGYLGGGGIAALESYQRHPEIFCSGNEGLGMYDTFLMDRAYFNEYDFTDIPGIPYGGKWHFWNAIYGASEDWGLDQLIESAKMFGWDGVRWDDHWTNGDDKAKKKISAVFPRYVYGYNSLNTNAQLYLPPVSSQADFAEIAQNHALMMDEVCRNYWSGSKVRDFYDAMGYEGDYLKRTAACPMIIPFAASPLGSRSSLLCALASGVRSYEPLGGDTVYGPLARFVTRYSAFIWDDTAGVADAGHVVSVNVGRGPTGAVPWYNRTTWLRKLPNGNQQLLVNLFNPPNFVAHPNRVQVPPALLYDLSITVPTPPGAKLVRTLHISPDTIEGLTPLVAQIEGGNAKVLLPQLHNWSIVLFEYAPDGTAPLAYPAFKLTTPKEDALAYFAKEDKAKLAKEQEAKRLELGLAGDGKAKPAEEKPIYYYDFAKAYNVDEDVSKKLARPANMAVRRDGVLDVLHCHGLFAWLDPVENGLGLAGGGHYESAWAANGNGSMSDFPENLEELLHFDVVVLDDLHAFALGPVRRAMINEYVKAGGGLVIFDGFDNLSMGADHNTALAELLPVTIKGRYDLIRDDKGMAFKPVKEGIFSPKIDWSKSPQVYCMDASPLKPGVEVLAKAGDHPVIVSQTVGKGRVVLMLMQPIGNYPDISLPYWKWSDWTRLIGSCLQYAAGDYKSVDPATAIVRPLDPKEENPESLMIQAPMLESPALTKKLASARKNIVDGPTARAAMSVALDYADKVEDQDLFAAIADAAGPYLDATFAPLGKKLLTSQQFALRRIGYEVIGLAADTSSHAQLENALESETDIDTLRAVLVAIGRIKTPESIPAVHRYIKKGSEKLLAWGTLKRLNDPAALSDGLAAYAIATRMVLGLHASYDGQWYGLSRMHGVTPAKYREIMRTINSTADMMRKIDFDTRYFIDSMSTLSDAELTATAEFLRTTTVRPVAPLAYTICGRLPEARADAFRHQLADAKLPQLKALAE